MSPEKFIQVKAAEAIKAIYGTEYWIGLFVRVLVLSQRCLLEY